MGRNKTEGTALKFMGMDCHKRNPVVCIPNDANDVVVIERGEPERELAPFYRQSFTSAFSARLHVAEAGGSG